MLGSVATKGQTWAVFELRRVCSTALVSEGSQIIPGLQIVKFLPKRNVKFKCDGETFVYPYTFYTSDPECQGSSMDEPYQGGAFRGRAWHDQETPKENEEYSAPSEEE